MGSVKRARRLDQELSQHGHAARRDRFRTQKAALENFDDGTSGQHCPVVRRHRRGEPRTGVARTAQHSRQPVCQVRATTPTGDPHGAERVRIGGPQADTGGKVAVESRSLPAHDRAETYPAPAGRQRTNAPPTGTAAPRPNGRLARSEASRTPRILGDRHLGSNRGCGAVKDAIRSFDRVYRNCEDPPSGANTGPWSRAASREVWVALRRAMRPPDVTRPPTSSRRRHRSAAARAKHSLPRLLPDGQRVLSDRWCSALPLIIDPFGGGPGDNDGLNWAHCDGVGAAKPLLSPGGRRSLW